MWPPYPQNNENQLPALHGWHWAEHTTCFCSLVLPTPEVMCRNLELRSALSNPTLCQTRLGTWPQFKAFALDKVATFMPFPSVFQSQHPEALSSNHSAMPMFVGEESVLWNHRASFCNVLPSVSIEWHKDAP